MFFVSCFVRSVTTLLIMENISDEPSTLQTPFLGDLDARDDAVRLRVGPRDLLDVATGQSRGLRTGHQRGP
jgi:hypothetical protein